MMRPVFLKAFVSLGPEDPDFREMFSPLEARRMSRLLKRAVWTSRKALEAALIQLPDAIVTATDFGSMSQSEAYLSALKQGEEATPKPTNFMQSTHNTIGSLIAIQLGCHGYNATYSHQGQSFRSALCDAWMQLSLGEANTALVGWFDESFPAVGAEDRAVSLVLDVHPGPFREVTRDLLQLEDPLLLGTILENK